jgi:hypothetical protein
MRVRVETFESAAGEMPKRVDFNQRSMEIAELLDQWHGADECYFKLRSADGNLYMLRFDELSGGWDLSPYQDLPA